MSTPRSFWPRLSVIIPTRDRPVLVKRAVSCVLDQDYPGAIECLVVFDQSPVNPVLVKHDNARRELRFLRNSRTPGLSGTRNSGALAAKGELVAFCDDDDEWLPSKARKQVKILTELGNVMVGCGISIQYGGRSIARLPPPVTSHRDLMRTFPMTLHSSTMMLRRTDMHRSLFDENMRHSEDYEWLIQIASKMNIVALQEPLVRVHWDRRSWFVGKWGNIVEGMNYLVKKHPELQGNHRGLARIYGQIAFAYAARGSKGEAKRWIFEALSLNWIEIRAYISLLVLSNLVRPETVLRWLNFFGRGL